MKRILLAGSALVGVAALATPAHADLKLDLGGYFRGYAVYEDNDTQTGNDTSHFDFAKDAEVHFTGETTTDMGLTVGAHFELKMLNGVTFDGSGYGLGGKNSTTQHQNFGSNVDESYAYFSGGWGRVNFGEEDGAAYLLQVAAPSADSNIDGLRPTVQGYNSFVWATGALNNGHNPFTGNRGNYVLGYDNADFRQTDRITYLTPKWSGFQAGVSYAPHQGAEGVNGNVSGAPFNNVNGAFKNLWEASARWDGEFSGVGISVGGGYSWADNEGNLAAGFGSDNFQTWDAGLNLTWQGWSLGGAYKHSNTATDTNGDVRTWDVGLGWDNGPWHAGASWMNTRFDANAYGNSGIFFNGNDLKLNRYTVGGGYTYGPGMSFRGAVSFMNVNTDAANADQTPVQVTLGTDINF